MEVIEMDRNTEIRRQIDAILNRNNDTRYLQNALSYIAALERAIHKEANNG